MSDRNHFKKHCCNCMNVSLVNLRLEDINVKPLKRPCLEAKCSQEDINSKDLCAANNCALQLRKTLTMFCLPNVELFNELSAYFAVKFFVATNINYDTRLSGSHSVLSKMEEWYSTVVTSLLLEKEFLLQVEMRLLLSYNWEPPCDVHLGKNTCKSDIGNFIESVRQMLEQHQPPTMFGGCQPDNQVEHVFQVHHFKSVTQESTAPSSFPHCNDRSKLLKFNKDPLGKGGNGTVYRYEVETDQSSPSVAIKWQLLHPSVGISFARIREICIGNYINSEFVIKTECAYLAKLDDQPSEVHPSFYVGLLTRRASMDLDTYVKRYFQSTLIKHIDVRRQIMEAILTGLDHMHKRGIAHFDMKPAQVLLDVGDETTGLPITRIQIADLGTVQLTGTTGRRVTPYNAYAHISGTVMYSAPETLMFSDYGNKCDIWSAGLIYLQLCCGPEYGRIFGLRHRVADPIVDWLPYFSTNVLDFEEWYNYWTANCTNSDVFRNKNWFIDKEGWRQQLVNPEYLQKLSSIYLKSKILEIQEERMQQIEMCFAALFNYDTDEKDKTDKKAQKLRLYLSKSRFPVFEEKTEVSPSTDVDKQTGGAGDAGTKQEIRGSLSAPGTSDESYADLPSFDNLSAELQVIYKLLTVNPDNRPSAEEALKMLPLKDEPTAGTSMRP